ncbi:MAG TPA: S41 family peptidase [Bacteroidales bacterium]|nr:S41 family peptidase [Bacteroidales bacterium]
MKKTITIILILCLSITLFAQKEKIKVPKPPVKITKEQMYEDYDQFLKIIETYNSQWEIRKKYTGYDMLSTLKERRNKIETIENYWEFINFMDKSLNFIIDVHADQCPVFYDIPHPRYAPGQSFYDSTYIAEIATGFEQYLNYKTANIRFKDCLQTIGAKYLDGNYYMTAHFTFKNPKIGDSICFQNARIIAYDHQPIDLFIKNSIGDMSPYSVRWDFKNNKYYTSRMFISFNKTLKVEGNDGKFYEFVPNNFGVQIQTFLQEEYRKNPQSYLDLYEKWDPQRISYLPEQKILYIYTKMMSGQEGYNLIDSIKSIGKGKQIEKIVIDVRGNQGGGDDFWSSMLSAIIKDTLQFQDRVALNYNDEVRAYFNAEFPVEMTKEFKMMEISFLENKKMLVREPICQIDPDTNSLQFDGPIYLFQDEETYSSGHSFTSLAKQIPQLVSMGVSTGMMAGFGFNPWGFQLKNSKFTFKFEPAVDLSMTNKWEDSFQCIPEIEVIPTLEEWNIYRLYQGITPLNEFLVQYDYLFKKVLEY